MSLITVPPVEPIVPEEHSDENLILLIDDNPSVGRTLERLVATYSSSIRVHNSRDEKSALKKLKQNQYELVFVDLRLNAHNNKGGLDLLKTLAPQNLDSTFILFTSNPSDPVIEREIERASEEERNFLMFVADKGNSNTLFEILKEYIKAASRPSINYDVIPSALLSKLQTIGKTLWDKEVNRIFEYGRLLLEAKETIELRRQELKEKIRNGKEGTEVDKREKEKYELEYKEISKLWSTWLTPYVDLSHSQMNVYMKYYQYFSDPQRKSYQKGIDLGTFTELTRKKYRGTRKDNPYILGAAEQQYLLDIGMSESLSAETVAKCVKIKKQLKNLPIPLVYRIALEPKTTVNSLLSANLSTSLSTEEIEELLAQSNKADMKLQLESVLSAKELKESESVIEVTATSLTTEWQTFPYYNLFQGTWQGAMASKPLRLGCMVIDQALAVLEPDLTTHLIKKGCQIITLRNMKRDDFDYLFEDCLERIKPYLPEGMVLGFYVLSATLEKINLTLKTWKQQQDLPPEEGLIDYQQTLEALSQKRDLYIIYRSTDSGI